MKKKINEIQLAPKNRLEQSLRKDGRINSRRASIPNQNTTIVNITCSYFIIIYHDFLPPPRRGSHVKLDNKHNYQDTLLSPYI